MVVKVRSVTLVTQDPTEAGERRVLEVVSVVKDPLGQQVAGEVGVYREIRVTQEPLDSQALKEIKGSEDPRVSLGLRENNLISGLFTALRRVLITPSRMPAM